MLRLPSGEVPWRKQVGRHGGERFYGRGDARREVPATQVEASQERVQAGYRGQSLGVSHDVHGAGMSASRHYEWAFSADLDDERLIIEDERVGLSLNANVAQLGSSGSRHASALL